MNIPFIKCWSSFLLVSRADLSYTKESSQIPSSDFSRLSLNEYSSLEGNQYAVMSWVGVCVCVSCLVVSDSLQPHRLAHQAALSMEFSKQEYWSGLPFASPGHIYIYMGLFEDKGGGTDLSLSLLWSMWDLPSPTRYWIHVPCVGSLESYTGPPEQSLRHHIFKPSSVLLILITQCCIASAASNSKCVWHFFESGIWAQLSWLGVTLSWHSNSQLGL